jgi:hypothetical protein
MRMLALSDADAEAGLSPSGLKRIIGPHRS